VASAVVAVVVAPTGSDFLFRAWVLPSAIAAAVVTLIVPILLVRRRTPPLWGVLSGVLPRSPRASAARSGVAT
jgi:alpha-1,6-mannosyltransferase